jgi:hypothetical protein
MSTTPATVEQLLRDIFDLGDIQIGTDSSTFRTDYSGKYDPPSFFSLHEHGFWLGVYSEQWRLFAKLDAVRRVRFVRGLVPPCIRPRPEEEEDLSVRLVGQNDDAALSFSLGRLYDEQAQPIAARFAQWEELRAKYGGQDELRVENGKLTPSRSSG